MKAIKATLKTSQPVITEDEFDTMFYKVPELHSLHSNFLEGLQMRTQNWDGKLTIGDHFKIMVNISIDFFNSLILINIHYNIHKQIL